ncbi:MAG: hypothetical protein L6R38_003162 [Xanthoria sp. 2 TBL-2021]|nr:MAG: hypothetical protein L6R38_003162 [Xanthoria sp. 2 TBL-2021]
MASPVKLSLEQRFAHQLRLDSDENIEEVATTSTPAVAVPPSRHLELAPHSFRIRNYLKENDVTFCHLDELKEKGWKAAEGDAHFKKQREAADQKDDEQEKVFHRIHLEIGNEMRAFGAFDVEGLEHANINALNLCMAPGAYTAAMLKQYPDASVCGITLPVRSGGHKMIIPFGPQDPRVDVKFLDITMLIREFLIEPLRVPNDHPDAANFIMSSPFQGKEFELVLCDGQALRTHERAKYREIMREARRLLAAQLIFGMTRIKQGGTFVVLLHKAEAWDTMCLLKNFCSFAKVALFKPESGHRQRSTFYLVAKDVLSASTEARMFIDDWKRAWTEATFGGEEGTGADPAMPKDAEVDALLHDFGPGLIHLAQGIWSIQANALDRSRWLQGSATSKTRRSSSIQSPVFSEAGEPSTPRHPNSVLGVRSRWQPSSPDSPSSPGAQFPKHPLASRSTNQQKYLHPEVDENKMKKMAGRWR